MDFSCFNCWQMLGFGPHLASPMKGEGLAGGVIKWVWVIFLCLFICQPMYAQGQDEAPTRVRLVIEQDFVKPDHEFWVGLDFKMKPGWHIYWQNPGDSGLSADVKWQVPRNIQVGPMRWPYPERITEGPLTSFGYTHDVYLLTPMIVKFDSQLPPVIHLHAKIKWLACQEICKPQHQELDLYLPLSNSKVQFNAFKDIFDKTRASFPQQMALYKSEAVLDHDQWRLMIHGPVPGHGIINFFPLTADVIASKQVSKFMITGNGYELNMAKSFRYQGGLTVLKGVAVNSEGWDAAGRFKALLINAPIGKAPQLISFWVACIFALIGGLILNLMPCVLPVLSIKVLHLLERHPEKKIAVIHSLVYALGILVSLWLLALLLIIIKSAGHFAGWGFQFQSPIFVLIVALILFVLALNLFGLFEFNIPAMNGLPQARTGYWASFISGVVTTVVATPCTAPLMGTALTLAISQPNIIGFSIFTCLGLGLASPFVLCSIFPSLLKFLPKPGLWMLNLKKFLGIILLACVLWMLSVFAIEIGWIKTGKIAKNTEGIEWQAYDKKKIQQARNNGQGVFIDFTASWCINCQLNDLLVFHNQELIRTFKLQNIAAFKADWTKYDPAITNALASFGRDSIPVYVYFAPGSNNAYIYPQIISPSIILNKIRDEYHS